MSADPLLAHLAATVRSLRGSRQWSRRALAEQTGISERFLADIEAGRGNPSLLRLAELARALGTTPSALLARPPSIPANPQRAVALLGLRGAGKSTVGAHLAERLGCGFVELDSRVEATAGLSLTEMFEVHGEAYYRRLEGEVLRAVLGSAEPQVLATGGGLVTEPATFATLRSGAHTVWLQARAEDHWSRVVAQGDTRPMANNAQAFTDLCALLARRQALYQQAEVQVDTSGRSEDDVAAELALRFAFLAAPRAEPQSL
ncbi:MAG: shikimate kinase [Planctomycetota bacterium]